MSAVGKAAALGRKRRREAKASESVEERALGARKAATQRMVGSDVERLARFAVEAMRSSDAAAWSSSLELLRDAVADDDRLTDGGVALANASMLLALAGCVDVALFAALARAVALRAPSLSAGEKSEARTALGVADVHAPDTFAALGGGEAPRLWAMESLVRLWQYSKTVPKALHISTAGEVRDDQWPPRFADPTLPLLVDVGCGFGASALAFAATQPGYNVIGCDRARHAMAYAKSVTARSTLETRGVALSERCAFVVADGLEVLRWVREAYAGECKWVLLQFPTPYALQQEESGGGGKTRKIGKNSQLPPSAKSGRFMCNDRLLKVVLQVVAPGGTIAFASNVEDVGVTVRASVARLGKQRVEMVVDAAAADDDDEEEDETALPLRTQRWVALGGARARGHGWLKQSVLPAPVRTETEACYETEAKPIHRFAFRKL